MILYVGLVVAGIIIGLMAASVLHLYTPEVKPLVPPPGIERIKPLYNCCYRCDHLENRWTELCHKCNGSGTHTPRMVLGPDGRIHRSIYQD